MHSLDKSEHTSNGGDTALLHAALDTMSYAFSVWSDDYKLMSFNGRLIEDYFGEDDDIQPGIDLLEICEKSIANGNYPSLNAGELYTRMRQRFAAVSKIGSRKTFVNVIRGRHVDVTYTRLPDVGWVITQKDITDKLQSEALTAQRGRELEQQNLRFDAAVNNMSHGLSSFNANRELVICNAPYAKMYGVPPELQKPGTSFWDILDCSANVGMVETTEMVALRHTLDGVINAAEPSAGPVSMSNGKVMMISHHPLADGGWLSIHEDITEQHLQAELIAERNIQLEQQNIRFNAAVNNMSHGLAMYDADLNLVICNEPFVQLYDLPENLTKAGVSFWAQYDKRDSGQQAKDKKRRKKIAETFKQRKTFGSSVELEDGTVMRITHQPIKDGGWLSTHEDITERFHTQATIEHLAHHDSLTGLANRNTFLQIMADGEERIASGEVFAVLCIDLDNFKPINDNLGHAAGDAVLVRAAKRIQTVIGESGTVARLGGDEFAALVGPISGPEQAEDILLKLVQRVSKSMKVQGLDISVGVSAGIAMAPTDGTDTSTLMRNADLALYRAKENYRSGYSFFEPEMEQVHKRRREIEAGLKSALANDQLKLVYQPLLSLKENRISCCEALMRWESDEHGFVGPDEFIPVAEDTGLIREMGGWALREACTLAMQWPEHVRVAVNVSPVQFVGEDLVDRVHDALRFSGLTPNRLELEITESLFLADSEHNLDILHALHKIGVRIALDDFGTGYSSLSYLRSFPFDKIKIDRTFISDLVDKPENDAIVRAVVLLGESLGMTTTAEGVETEEQLDVIRTQGCTEAQGYLFSRPLSGKDIALMMGFAPKSAEMRKAQ